MARRIPKKEIEAAVRRQQAKRKQRSMRVKMRTSFHGRAILIPKNIAASKAVLILREELRNETPVDTGKAKRGWVTQSLARGALRAVNQVAYIRRLMIDGYSKQSAPGAYKRAIAKARAKIREESVALIKAAKRRKVTKK